MTLIKQCEPDNVVLVHGEGSKMSFLHDRIKDEYELPCYYPANGETITIDTPICPIVDANIDFLNQKSIHRKFETTDQKLIQGILKLSNEQPELCNNNEIYKYGLIPWNFSFKSFIKLDNCPENFKELFSAMHEALEKYILKKYDPIS